VTGACGNIGSRLVPLLVADPDIEHVFGVDIATGRMPAGPRWTPVGMDVRDPAIRSIVGEADCLVHLAFVVKNIHDDARTREINLGGTQNLLEACRCVRMRRIVFTSSVSVYGYHPENVTFIKEDTPLRPDPCHVYSTCKAAIEDSLERFAVESPGSRVCILRPSLVMGPHVDNSLANLFRRRTFLAVKGFDPRVQAVHVDDLARALHLAVKREATGVFNVAASDAFRVSEICRLFGIRRISIPVPLLHAYLRVGYRTGLSHIPPQSAPRFLYSLTVDSIRFREAFEWRPVYSTLRCIDELRNGGFSY